MPYSDSKTRKVRGKSWTREDERRWEAQQRRQRKEDAKAQLEREREILRMKANGTYDAYIESQKLKKQAEDVAQAQWVLQQKEDRDVRLLQKSSNARLMAGSLQTEFVSAIGWRERHSQPEGDWLDDPVMAVTTGYGFGEEVRTSQGIRLQVNLCLDCSNSMVHNGLDRVSQDAVRDMYLGMRMAAADLPTGSMTINVWIWAGNTDGKWVSHLTSKSNVEKTQDNPMGPLDGWWANFDGEDTWIAPLFARLEQWENKYGDPGAYRLDIIVTDGVLEHVTDSREADKIQERRDGALQTVMLNFLPSEDWADSRVPKRCVQYPATPDNIVALMRSVLGYWLVNIV